MVSKYLAYNGKVSLIYADTTELLNCVKNMQDYSDMSEIILGKFYTASSLMALSEVKEESDEIVIKLDGKGISGILYSIVKKKNNNIVIKGFIENKSLNYDLNIGKLIGKEGNLTVIKNNIYTKLGYKGITPLISGNIVDDFKSYFETSTQKPAFLDIETTVDNSYGYLITFMPDCDEKDIEIVKQNLKKIVLIDLKKENNSYDQIAKIISGDNNIVKIEDNLEIIYKCDCSKSKYEDMLYTLKKAELEELLKDDNGINIVCQYCNKSYDFSKEELEEIIKNL